MDAIGLNCGIRKVREDKFLRSQGSEKSIGSKSLEGSSIWGRLGLEGLLLFVNSNFIL